MSATVCPDCRLDVSRLAPCSVCADGIACCPCVHADERVTICKTTRSV